MIDVVTLRANEATRSGNVEVYLGEARLTGDSGTLLFRNVAPTKMTRWTAAEFFSIGCPGCPAVKVRLVYGGGRYYIGDTADGLRVLPVSDPSSWDSEYMLPYLLGNLDLWSHPELQLEVRLEATADQPDPRVSEIRLLVDHPTWEGAVAHAVRSVATKIESTEFVLIHSETLTAARGSWKIGKPHSEHNLDVTSLVQATVDGRHKSANLVDGEVVLDGPPAPAGSIIEIAVSVLPSCTVRRADETRIIDRTPSWWLADLVTEGGLVGTTTPMSIGGREVSVREQELRITVNGVSHRQADALAMRAALQEAFAPGLTITYPSGRTVFAQLDGLVEVVDGGPTNLPMATGTVTLVVREFVFSKLVRDQRDSDGHPVTTELSVLMPDGVQFTATEDSFNC